MVMISIFRIYLFLFCSLSDMNVEKQKESVKDQEMDASNKQKQDINDHGEKLKKIVKEVGQGMEDTPLVIIAAGTYVLSSQS